VENRGEKKRGDSDLTPVARGGSGACRAPSPPERTRAETGGADQWVLKQRELPGFAIVDETKRPHPWDTHYQFSIKTLLSKQKTP